MVQPPHPAAGRVGAPVDAVVERAGAEQRGHADRVDAGGRHGLAAGRGEHQDRAEDERDEERPLVRDAAQAGLAGQRQLGLLEASRWFYRARHALNPTRRSARRGARTSTPTSGPYVRASTASTGAGACIWTTTSHPPPPGHRMHHVHRPHAPGPGAPVVLARSPRPARAPRPAGGPRRGRPRAPRARRAPTPRACAAPTRASARGAPAAPTRRRAGRRNVRGRSASRQGYGSRSWWAGVKKPR